MSFTRILIHWGITTKNRRPCLPSTTDALIDEVISRVCQAEKAKQIATGASVDHIHSLTSISPDKQLSRIVSECKKDLRRELAAVGIEIDWARGYWGFSVGASNWESVQLYVLEQRQRHADGYSLDAEMEVFRKVAGLGR